MRILITIMAHGGAQGTFDRHLAYWKAHGYRMVVVHPEDDPVRTGLETWAIGKKEHHGPEANRRFRLMLERLKGQPEDWHVIFEYDSVCLHPELPSYLWKEPGLWSNRFENNDRAFQGRYFTHPPLAVDADSLERLVRAARFLPDEAEHGFWDRWLGLLCERADVPIYCWDYLGYSQNTIQPWHMENACYAAKRGAIMLHGIKEEKTLNQIADAAGKALLTLC